MTDVACFCGCCYSFEGDGEACPRCGEYAAVRSGPALASTGRNQPEPVPAANGAGAGREPARVSRDAAKADSGRLVGLPAGAAARG
jgi:hypothetical protein